MAELIGSGRDADVFAAGPDRVLRRYRRGGDVGPEAEVMCHLGAHGYPVPAVYRAEGPDLEMERLSGPTMLAALISGDLDFAQGAALLADLHHRLHALPPPRPGEPGTCVIHRDLHPGNVILTPRGPVVIDWRDAREGTAEFDLAMSAVVFGSVALARSGPFADLAPVARNFVERFVPLVAGPILLGLDKAVEDRSGNANLDASEREDVLRAADLIRHLASASHARSATPAAQPPRTGPGTAHRRSDG